MAFSFKAMVEADRRRTFLNLDEFGEKHTVEGKAIAAVLDDNALKISIHALREEGDSKNRDKISIFL